MDVIELEIPDQNIDVEGKGEPLSSPEGSS